MITDVQAEEIVGAIRVKDGYTVKRTKNTLRVIAPAYSSHSAFLDESFSVAKKHGISYRGSGHGFGEDYTVTFTKK